MNDYTANGYKNRREYLDSLVEAYGLPPATVYTMAAMLGESEDFDGLIVALDDAADEAEREEFWSLTLEKEPTE
jgi:hypothetical protein